MGGEAKIDPRPCLKDAIGIELGSGRIQKRPSSRSVCAPLHGSLDNSDNSVKFMPFDADNHVGLEPGPI
jgi:hypothetical protein